MEDAEAALKRLGRSVDAELAQIGRRNAKSVIKIGEHLIAAKAVATHGRFRLWLNERRLNARTAQRYMERAREYDALSAEAKSDMLSHLPKLSYPALLKSIEKPAEKKPRPKPAARPAIESRSAEAAEPGNFDRLMSINDVTTFAQELWNAIGMARARAVYSLFGELLEGEDERWNTAEPAKATNGHGETA